jgi:hypothetical protein
MKKKFFCAAIVVFLLALAAPVFAATNPFMDVPASHWAYDAVAQLASRGIISGYPDGSYKGTQPSTRYEMASVIARSLAKVDLEKASTQDVDMLKRLIIEFKDELDALGVRVDSLDERVAVIETDLGGWSLAGEFEFNARFGQDGTNKGWYADDVTYSGDNEFDLADYAIYLQKRVNETTSFYAKLDNPGGRLVQWANYYITTTLPYDISLTAGHADLDWEGDLDFYVDNEPMIGDWTFNMFLLEKDWGIANLKLLVGRIDDGTVAPSGEIEIAEIDADPSLVAFERFLIAGNANFTFNEKFRAGLLGYFFLADDEYPLAPFTQGGPAMETDTDLTMFGAYAAFAFTPSIEGKAIYYQQSYGDTIAYGFETDPTVLYGDSDDSASAWKVILDVDQEALKFTSAWLEYGQIDNNFITNERFAIYSGEIGVGATYADGGASLLANMPNNTNNTTIYGIRLDQEWNEKWRTYLRYFAADHDTAYLDDAVNWSIGVGYRLNDAVEFELAYDTIDYGDSNFDFDGSNVIEDNERNLGGRFGDDHVIRFKTYVTF